MSKSYNIIFWGFIFLLFHINLGEISIIPNFICYTIIYIGITKLLKEKDNKSLKQSSMCCIILIVITFILSGVHHLGKDIDNLYLLSLIDNIPIVINIIMVYKLLYGSYELFQDGNNELNTNINSWIIYYVTVETGIAIIRNINVIFSNELLVAVSIIASMIVQLSIISLWRKLYKHSVDLSC